MLHRRRVVPSVDQEALNNLSGQIIECAIQVHSILGPGLLESAYRACMIYELHERGIPVASELLVPISYKEILLEGAYRIDLLVDRAVVVGLKSIETVLPVCRTSS